jgi:c-di-GMP-related signal transduction protein
MILADNNPWRKRPSVEVIVARQPIFTKSKQIYGYELLFRDAISNVFHNVEGNAATSRVLSNSLVAKNKREKKAVDHF